MTGPEPPPDRSWVEFNLGLGDKGPRQPPPWIDWGEDDRTGRGPIARFMEQHTNWFIVLVVVAVVVVVGGAMVLSIVFGGLGGLVYDPQVVHRTVIGNDGRAHDCAVSHSGMSCDWGS